MSTYTLLDACGFGALHWERVWLELVEPIQLGLDTMAEQQRWVTALGKNTG